jgi:predicted DNA-binding protein
VGTVNGYRIPVSHFRFQYHLLWEELGEDAWMFDELTISEHVFDQMVDLHVVLARADEFGVVLSPEDIENSRLEADWIRENLTHDGNDLIRQMGFSRSSFYRLTDMLTLYNAIRLEIGSRLEVTSEKLAEAYGEYIEENIEDFTRFHVYMVEVEDEELAANLLRQIISGADIADVINEHNVASLFADSEDNIISGDIMHTNAGSAHISMVREMEPGDFSEVGPLAGGNYGFFMLDDIIIDIPEEMEQYFNMEFEAHLRHAHFREYADFWISQSNFSQNARFFRGLFSAPEPDLDIDWDNFDWESLIDL